MPKRYLTPPLSTAAEMLASRPGKSRALWVRQSAGVRAVRQHARRQAVNVADFPAVTAQHTRRQVGRRPLISLPGRKSTLGARPGRVHAGGMSR